MLPGNIKKRILQVGFTHYCLARFNQSWSHEPQLVERISELRRLLVGAQLAAEVAPASYAAMTMLQQQKLQTAASCQKLWSIARR